MVCGLLTVVPSLATEYNTVAVKHALSRPTTCEIFPGHEWIQCPPRCQTPNPWTKREAPLHPQTQWILMEAEVLNCRDLSKAVSCPERCNLSSTTQGLGFQGWLSTQGLNWPTLCVHMCFLNAPPGTLRASAYRKSASEPLHSLKSKAM